LQDVATSPFCTPGHWFQLAIAARDSDQLIGDIGVQLHGGAGLLAEIGFTLAPAAQGRGLATEAVGAMVQMAAAHTPVQRIVAVADTRNAASLRLLQRLGLRPFATLPAVFRGQPCLERTWVAHRHGRIAVDCALARAGRRRCGGRGADRVAPGADALCPWAHSDEENAWLGGQHLIPGGGVTVA
jgi:GNAT superfamily N-acetyltransferase